MSLQGLTNLGEWIAWNPLLKKMEVHHGGSIIFEKGIVSEVSKKHYESTHFLDVQGRFVSPGFVDSHTHPAFAETRELEFELRSQGKSYQEIAAAGGGIRNSVRKLRNYPEDQLVDCISSRFTQFLAHGTTTLECKSGYGLSTESELKSLRAIQKASNQSPIQTKSTFLGAHEIPDEYRDNREKYIDLLIHEMLPLVKEQNLAEFCDVFCEDGVYTTSETQQIFVAAKTLGFKLKLHADEFASTGGAELAVEMGALSADHLMAISDRGIQKLSGSDTVATLLPGTTLFLGTHTYAPARKLLDNKVHVALATDYNPGSSMILSMPMILSLAVIYLHMKPLEAFQSSTIEGARALGISDKTGTIYPNFGADCVVWNAKNHRQIPYHIAQNLVKHTIVKGTIV
jgi:imidazolonepropionase